MSQKNPNHHLLQLISAFLLPTYVPYLQSGQYNWDSSDSLQQSHELEQLSCEQCRRQQQLFKYLKLLKNIFNT